MKMMAKIAYMRYRNNTTQIQAKIETLRLEHAKLLLALEQEENKTTGRKWIKIREHRIMINEYHTEIAERALRLR